MFYSKISISQAMSEFNLWGELINKNAGIYHPASTLNVKRLSNSINLVIAYDYYKLPDNFTKDEYLKLEKWVKQINDSVIQNYSKLFLLDGFCENLAKYPTNSVEYKTKGREYSVQYLEFLLKEQLFDVESNVSFFEFCSSLRNDDPIYWQLVYRRLKLEENNNDKKIPDYDLPNYDLPIYNKRIDKNESKYKFNEKLDVYLLFLSGLFLLVFFIFSNRIESLLYHYIYFGLICGSYVISRGYGEMCFLKKPHPLSNRDKILNLLMVLIISVCLSFAVTFIGKEEVPINYQKVFEWFTLIFFPAIIGINESFKKDTGATYKIRKEAKDNWDRAQLEDYND